jgi:hypothetical protein
MQGIMLGISTVIIYMYWRNEFTYTFPLLVVAFAFILLIYTIRFNLPEDNVRLIVSKSHCKIIECVKGDLYKIYVQDTGTVYVYNKDCVVHITSKEPINEDKIQIEAVYHTSISPTVQALRVFHLTKDPWYTYELRVKSVTFIKAPTQQ